MALSLKQKIVKIEEAADVLDEMIQDTDQLLPSENKHITDRLNAIVADVRAISECLRQKGFLDEELVEVFESAA